MTDTNPTTEYLPQTPRPRSASGELHLNELPDCDNTYNNLIEAVSFMETEMPSLTTSSNSLLDDAQLGTEDLNSILPDHQTRPGVHLTPVGIGSDPKIYRKRGRHSDSPEDMAPKRIDARDSPDKPNHLENPTLPQGQTVDSDWTNVKHRQRPFNTYRTNFAEQDKECTILKIQMTEGSTGLAPAKLSPTQIFNKVVSLNLFDNKSIREIRANQKEG